jgi:hypothetical protein
VRRELAPPGPPPSRGVPPFKARIGPMNFWRRDHLLPLALVVIGIFFLLRNLNLLDWLDGKYIWPIVLIVLGAWLILRRTRV